MSQQVEFPGDGPGTAPVTVGLAHGAGAGMNTPFMAAFARGLAINGLRVVRFEFPLHRLAPAGGQASVAGLRSAHRATWLTLIE